MAGYLNIEERGFKVDGTEVITSSRVLQNIASASINGALTVGGHVTLGGASASGWASGYRAIEAERGALLLRANTATGATALLTANLYQDSGTWRRKRDETSTRVSLGYGTSFPAFLVDVGSTGAEDGEVTFSSALSILHTGVAQFYGDVLINAIRRPANNERVRIWGGSTTSTAQGGGIDVYGNGYTNIPGDIRLLAGVGAGAIRMYTGASTLTERFTITPEGYALFGVSSPGASGPGGARFSGAVQMDGAWGTAGFQATGAGSGTVLDDFGLAANAGVLRWQGAAPGTTFTGFLGGWGGRRLTVINATVGQTVTLAHLTGSSVGNQIRCPGGVDLAISGSCAVDLIYDSQSAAWRVISVG